VTWIVAMLLTASRTATMAPVPVHPGDLGAMASGTKQKQSAAQAEKKTSRIMRVFEIWSGSPALSTDVWQTKLIPFVIDGVLSSPDDSVWIQFASKMAPRMYSWLGLDL